MRIREEIWMKANPLSGGSSCMEELTWDSGAGTPFSLIFWLGADGFGGGGGMSGTLQLD